MKALLALALVASVAGAQTPPPVTHIAFEPKAVAFLDSMASTTRTARIETVGCLTSYTVHGDTLVMSRLERSKTIAHADSAGVWGTSPYLCPMGVPSIHTHGIITGYEWWQASQDNDVASSKHDGVWAMVLMVSDHGWRLILY